MTNIEEMKEKDLGRVREMIIALRQHHLGGADEIPIDLAEFVWFLRRHCMHGLVLMSKADAIGCLIYLPDVSPILGGRGFELNQFYIETAHRQHGFGHLMIQDLFRKVLQANGTYVKVVFQSNLNLGHVYTRFGFENLTTMYPGLHLFMVEGREKLKQFLSLTTEDTTDKEVVVEVIPFTELNSSTRSLYPPWRGELPTKDRPLPTGDIFPQPNVIRLTGASGRVCMFTEQGSLFCWSGLKVYFSDFLGYTGLISPRLLQHRVSTWLDKVPLINTVEWEVACGSGVPCERASHGLGYSASQPLVRVLRGLNVLDSTVDKGINIAYIGESDMRERLHDG